MSEAVKPVRVLHVTDGSSLAELIRAAAESDPPIEIQTATSSAEGHQQLVDGDVDCIVVDHDLPNIDGIELLETVREDYPSLPFILRTDGGSEKLAKDAISADVSEYLHTDQKQALLDRIVDLVEQYRADHKRELERTSDLLAKTERIADVGGWEIDTETREVFWTDHLFDILGVKGDEEPPLEEALDFYHEADRPIIASAVDEALTDGEPFDVDVRFVRPNGEVRWLRVQGVLAVENGTVETLRGAVQDVTERHNRERVLREMHDIISDRDHSFDQQVRKLLELGRRELDTQYGTLSEIDGDDYTFEIVASDDDSIQEGDVVPVSATNCEIAASTERTVVLGDVERDAPDETDRAGFAEWGIGCYLGAPVFVDDEVYGTFCFYGTETKNGQFSDWEETLVDLMSRWVSYELQRRQVTEQLHEQNEQLERFASIVSHDLRNPLGIIEGYVDIAVETGDVSELHRVQAAVERMDTLIDDVLLLSRTENAISERSTIDLRTLVEQCWETVPTEKATVSVQTDRRVDADKTRLRQLFENLIRNAVEHGGENVQVTFGDLDDGFYIEDDGPGIPEDVRKTVFEGGYSTSHDGTGLGLSIVDEIVAAHGWEIRITTGTEGGARFEITGVEAVD